jgi:hypothetical protein
MMRFLVAVLFVGHGLVHGIMFSLPFRAPASADLPFDPSHSWLVGDRRSFGFGFALTVALAFGVAGGAYLAQAGWWPTATIVASALSFALLLVYWEGASTQAPVLSDVLMFLHHYARATPTPRRGLMERHDVAAGVFLGAGTLACETWRRWCEALERAFLPVEAARYMLFAMLL